MFIDKYIYMWIRFIQIIIFYMIFLSFFYALLWPGSAWPYIPENFKTRLGFGFYYPVLTFQPIKITINVISKGLSHHNNPSNLYRCHPIVLWSFSDM